MGHVMGGHGAGWVAHIRPFKGWGETNRGCLAPSYAGTHGCCCPSLYCGCRYEDVALYCDALVRLCTDVAAGVINGASSVQKRRGSDGKVSDVNLPSPPPLLAAVSNVMFLSSIRCLHA